MLGCSLTPFVHSPTPIFYSGLPWEFHNGLSKMVHPEHFLNSALQKISREFTGSHEIPYEFLLAPCSLADEEYLNEEARE